MVINYYVNDLNHNNNIYLRFGDSTHKYRPPECKCEF